MKPNFSDYIISEGDDRTFTVIHAPSYENLSHHESRPEALAAVKRYEAADKRRAGMRAASNQAIRSSRQFGKA